MQPPAGVQIFAATLTATGWTVDLRQRGKKNQFNHTQR
jgi:hypothetical protein